MNDKMTDAIKYCMIKRKTGRQKDVLDKIGKALHECNGSDDSIKQCIILLKVLIDEE